MPTTSKSGAVIAWALSVLLAALFLMAGVPKLLGARGHIEHFARWGYPDWFHLVVGAIETVSAVLLLVPRAAAVGASGIMVIMAGATYTHLFRAQNETARVPFTLALLLLAGAVAYLRTRRPR
jgi:uncharacterized membrane protein YphA (DoxX/SURF4 family)